MHPNPAFRATPMQDNLAFARARGFGVLSVNGAEGPLAAHVPFLISEDGSFAELHLARSNPIARACTRRVARVDRGVWAGCLCLARLVWQRMIRCRRGITSPCICAGCCRPLPEDALRSHVDALSAEHENRLLPKVPWVSDKMSDGAMPRMMRMILPFRFQIAAVEGTWKLNQNKTPEVRARAADQLAQQADAGARAIAALMRQDLG